MGPAILLCPSSSAAQLWGQALPSMKLKQKDGGISMSQRCSASAGDLSARPAFSLHSASSSEKCRRYFAWRRVSAAAAASEVSVEEAVAVSDAEQSLSAEPPTTSEGTPAAEKTQPKRTLNRSNSNVKKAAVVSPAELVPGAQFPGKVVAIQTFGAFVDFGAFTNGLVHISRLSKSYVKKVEDVVQVGQDVKVQILEVDFEANRISLMLVEEAKEEALQEEADKDGETQPQRAAQQQTRAPRRDAAKRPPAQNKPATTLKKGEIVMGTVKNMIKSGVFLSLPDGTDGYLPVSEVIFKAPNNTSLEAQFQVGEEVSVRVLRIERGRVNLSMRREVNFDKLNEDLNKGVIGMATNPFELAFRRNEVIASYLAERDKQKAEVDLVDEVKEEEAAASFEEMKDVTQEQRAETSDAEGEAAASVEEVKGVAEEPIVESSIVKEEEAASDEVKDVAEEQRLESSDDKEEGGALVEEVKDVAVEQTAESSGANQEAAPSVEEVKAEQSLESSDAKEEDEAKEQQVESSEAKAEAVSVPEVKDVAEDKPVQSEDAKEGGEPVKAFAEEQQLESGGAK